MQRKSLNLLSRLDKRDELSHALCAATLKDRGSMTTTGRPFDDALRQQ